MIPPSVREALAFVRIVRVGSGNGPKIEAVRSALTAYVDGVQVQGEEVESGVSEQPVGFEEIVVGARNRARAALLCGPCDLAVGLEDGLIELPGVETAALNVGAAVVTDGPRESFGLSAAFSYPPGCLGPALKDRAPIGALFDDLWREYCDRGNEMRFDRSIGNIGKLTLGVLPRSDYGRHAVLCALVRFLHPALYSGAYSGAAGSDRGITHE